MTDTFKDMGPIDAGFFRRYPYTLRYCAGRFGVREMESRTLHLSGTYSPSSGVTWGEDADPRLIEFIKEWWADMRIRHPDLNPYVGQELPFADPPYVIQDCDGEFKVTSAHTGAVLLTGVFDVLARTLSYHSQGAITQELSDTVSDWWAEKLDAYDAGNAPPEPAPESLPEPAPESPSVKSTLPGPAFALKLELGFTAESLNCQATWRLKK